MEIKAVMLVKEVNFKSLVSLDKGGRITLEVLDHKDITTLKHLADHTEIKVIFILPDEG